MRYPDGSTVRLGDLVWWDDESSIGRIIGIHESKEQCAIWGVEDPGVAICYDGSGMGGLFVGYPQSAFVEEGIRRVTPKEEAEVDRVVQAARTFCSGRLEAATPGLFRKKSHWKYWNVVWYCNHLALYVIEVNMLDFSCREIPLEDSGLFYDLRSGKK